MNKINLLLIILGLFIIALVASLVTTSASQSSYEVGYSTGYYFATALKVLGLVGLIYYGIRTLKKKSIKA